METLKSSAWMVDLVLAMIVAEALAVALYLWTRGRLRQGASLLATLASGFSLALALRLALADSPLAIMALCLLAGLLCHLGDLVLRLRR
jgi:hypothetical protein